MKNWIYYTLMYILLSLWGVIKFLDIEKCWGYYCILVVILGGASCLLDFAKIRKISCQKIYYIERRFLCLDYLFFYKIILTICCIHIIGLILHIEDKTPLWGFIFVCLFAIIYINTFPMYYVIMDSETLDAYIDEKKITPSISIKATRNKDVHCYLKGSDLRNISTYSNSH